MTQREAGMFIRAHGHGVVAMDAERIVAASVVVTRDGAKWFEYETFSAPYHVDTIREWLGY